MSDISLLLYESSDSQTYYHIKNTNDINIIKKLSQNGTIDVYHYQP